MKLLLKRLARWIGFALLAIAILLIGAWCSVAIWYRCTAGEPVRGLLAGLTLVFALFTVACLATGRRWVAFTIYAPGIALFFMWWATITATNNRNWAPEVARTVTATIDGDRLVVSNVRNFTWRSERLTCDSDPHNAKRQRFNPVALLWTNRPQGI
jgi:hypothetical protein